MCCNARNCSAEVGRTEWRLFVETLRLDLSAPGTQGLGFSEWIPGDALTAHQSRVRAEGFPDYLVRPPGNRAAYSAIVYLEPFVDRNLRAFGYDMFTESVRRAAMEKARDTGEPTLSGKVVLVQESSVNVQAGTLMYLAVYRDGVPVDTVERRRAALLGWVYSPYRMDDLIIGTLGPRLTTSTGAWVGLEIFAGETTAPEALLFENLTVDSLMRLGPSVTTETVRVSVADQLWTLRFSHAAESLPVLSSLLVGMIGTTGTGLSVLMFVLALSMLSARARAVQLAKDLTMVDMPYGFQYCRMIFEAGQPVDWEYLIVNSAFGTQTGLGEVSGRRVSEVLPGLRASDPGLFERFARVAQGGVPERFELFVTCLGKWFEYSVYSPTRNHFVAVFNRIDDRIEAQTQLHESEARLRTVIEGSASASYKRALDADHYEYMSPVIEQITGYSLASFEGLTLRDIATMLHPDDREAVAALVTSAVPNTPCEVEYRLRDAAGQYRWLNDRFSLVADPEGRLALVGNITDITETKRAEAKRAELEAQQHQFDRSESLNRMASSVAHLFNNHLQAVVSNLELLRLGPQGADEHLVQARVSLSRATEVSQLLLTYLGQSPAEKAALDFAVLCQRTLGEFRAALPLRVTLAVHWPATPVIVHGNAELLALAVANLLNNAREAVGREGQIDVVLETAVLNELTGQLFPGDWKPGRASAVLRIADNGVGIPATDLPKLTEPFFSTKAVGRGLGLSVVAGVLTMHEGVLAIESHPGVGSTFRLIVPLANEPLPLEPQVALAPEMQTGTVLFVDDDEAVREVTGELIGLLGYQVLTAAGGFEAVELVNRHAEELVCVVTDLSMPVMDGWELLSRVRQLDPGLPVLLVSGFDASQAMTGEHPVQPDGFLAKPFGLRPLRETLARLVQSRRRA